MFERFTDRARRVVVLAQDEARLLQHNYIGTEHLLLGLAAEGEGVGWKALERLGVTTEVVRTEVERMVGRGGGPVLEGHIPFTPRAKRALELSLREALQLGHNYIGTEHVLLGLLREGEGVAFKILQRHTDGIGVVRTTVVDLLSAYTAGSTLPSPGSGGTPTATKYSPALEAALETAVGRVGPDGIVGTHHVLSVFAEWNDIAANKVLRAGGFDASTLETPIAEWDVADTRDEPDEAWSERVIGIDAGEDGLSIRILDDELRGRLVELLSADDEEVRGVLRRAMTELLRNLPEAG